MIPNEHSSGTILIVDDNPQNLSVLFKMLDNERYHTLLAQSGMATFEILEYTIPQLILLDISMEGMDGYEVCNRLKSDDRFKDIPVIFITALHELEDKVHGFQAGAVDYITKPIQQEEVLARVKTHLSIRRYQEELKRQNANKDRFFSIIAHDLKAPVRGLHFLYEVLLEQLSAHQIENPELSETQQLLKRTLHKLSQFVDHLLDWASVQMDQITFSPSLLVFNEIIKNILETLLPLANNKNIRIVNEIEPNLKARADYHMITVVLINLLTNAIKFTPVDGQIRIQSKAEKEHIIVSIQDSGIGIKPEEQQKLFQFEQRFSKKGTAGEEGTGMGLVLCKDFVEKHGGTIWVKSQLNEGTTFSFSLPINI